MIKKGRGKALRLFGASWFLAAFLPISNIVQLNATVAEHWLYLPSVGLLIFLAGCAFELPLRHHRTATAIVLLAATALGVRSFVRSGDWATEETFYKRTLAAGATSGRVAVNLAQIYVRRGDYTAAEKILRHLMETSPDYPTGRNTFAALLSLQGKKAAAEALLAATVKMAAQTRRDYPRTWWAALTLAQFRHEAKDDQAAMAILKDAREAYPNVWDLIKLEAELCRLTQGPTAALPLVEKFARENWWHYGAALALGRLYAQKDDAGRAEAELRRASRLDVHNTEALHLIVIMRLNQNRGTTRVRFSGVRSRGSQTNRASTFCSPIFLKRWDAGMKRAPHSRKSRVCARWRVTKPSSTKDRAGAAKLFDLALESLAIAICSTMYGRAHLSR